MKTKLPILTRLTYVRNRIKSTEEYLIELRKHEEMLVAQTKEPK